VDRAWRKFKDNIKDNKQCKQTADTAAFLVEPFASTAMMDELLVIATEHHGSQHPVTQDIAGPVGQLESMM
jgi:hypothetical protein